MGLDLKIIKRAEDGTIYFSIGNTPSYAQGVDILVQMVAIAYLENPGQDVQSPLEGSGVRTLIGQYDVVNQTDLKVEFLSRTSKIEREIIQRQSNLTIKADERLKRLSIVSLNINSETSELIADVAIENQAGQTIVVRV